MEGQTGRGKNRKEHGIMGAGKGEGKGLGMFLMSIELLRQLICSYFFLFFWPCHSAWEILVP